MKDLVFAFAIVLQVGAMFYAAWSFGYRAGKKKATENFRRRNL